MIALRPWLLVAGLLGSSLPTDIAVAQNKTQIAGASFGTLQTARNALLGVWRGSYVCAQGETGVELSFTQLHTDGVVVGTFSFFNLPGHNNSESGEYTLIGRLDVGTGELFVNPGRWIRQPPGYAPVGFSASFASANRILGRVIANFPGCSQIYADKSNGASQYQQPLITRVTWPPPSATPSQESEYSQLLDDLVFQDSQSWAVYEYAVGSMRKVTVEQSPDGKRKIVNGYYTYTNGKSGWVEAEFVGDQLSCLHYWDRNDCRKIGEGAGRQMEKAAAEAQRQEQLHPHPSQPASHERDWSVGNAACNAWVGRSPWDISSPCNQ